MLPLIKLPPSELRLSDAAPGAALPVAEDPGARDGGFAAWLQSRIGEHDPADGNALPLPGTELPLFTTRPEDAERAALPPPAAREPRTAATRVSPPALEFVVNPQRVAAIVPAAIVPLPPRTGAVAAAPHVTEPESRTAPDLEIPAVIRGAAVGTVTVPVPSPERVLPLAARQAGDTGVLPSGPMHSRDSAARQLPPARAILEPNEPATHPPREESGLVGSARAERRASRQASFELAIAMRPGEAEVPPAGKPRADAYRGLPSSAAPASETRPAVSADVDRHVTARVAAPVSSEPGGDMDSVVRQDSPAAQKSLAANAPPAAAGASEAASLAAAGPRAGFDTTLLATRPSISQSIDFPVMEAGWDKAMSERVLLMANGRLQNAEIRLMPRELGPLRVEVKVDDGVASVSFHTQHAITRDAIEHALPRLREMLAEQGLSLGQTSVGDDGVQRETRDHRGSPVPGEPVSEDDRAIDESPAHVSPDRTGDGFVDTFV